MDSSRDKQGFVWYADSSSVRTEGFTEWAMGHDVDNLLSDLRMIAPPLPLGRRGSVPELDNMIHEMDNSSDRYTNGSRVDNGLLDVR